MKTPPIWVGNETHVWQAKLGGGAWYQAENIFKRVAQVMPEYPKPVMVGVRSDRRDPYRFDLDTWDSNAETHGYWKDRCAAEHTLKIFEGKNSEFIWSMPTPIRLMANPWPDTSPKGSAHLHQTPEYYAAYLQYLTAPATMRPFALKQRNYPFFTDASCTTINLESEKALKGKWSNLRFKRGRYYSYPIQAVILGTEPYGDAQETMSGVFNGKDYGKDSGKLYGETILKYLKAFDDRGIKIPLGLNIPAFFPMTDFKRPSPWFKELFDVLGERRSRFSYLDMYHQYSEGHPDYEWNRIHPGIRNTTPIGGSVQSNGFQNYWLPKSAWPPGVDYSEFMWMWNDVRAALKMIGEDPARWTIGCSEHGMATTTKNCGNNMGAGIYLALWYSELMRFNVRFNMTWVLSEMGNAQAQIQVKDGNLTRTPWHYVTKLAQQCIGLEHVSNTYQSPTATSGTMKEGGTYISPDVVVRTFKRPNGGYTLFVINKGTQTAKFPGWEQWMVTKWRIIKGDNYLSQNPIGNPWNSETVKTEDGTGFANGIPPISINLIELA